MTVTNEKEEKTRIVIDCLKHEKQFLKLQATLENKTLKDFIFDCVFEHRDLDPESFKKGLERIRKERHQLAKNLSKR